MKRFAPIVAALVSSLTIAGVAQQAPAFRATTHLVRVDAVVTDATGAPVTGLRAADFLLLDRGAPQVITTFEEVRHPLGSILPVGHQDVATNRADGTGQLLVLVLDDVHIRKEWTEHARAIVEDFVRDLSDDTLIAVLSSSGKYNIEVTSDRQRVIDMLERFSGREPGLAYYPPRTPIDPPAPPRPFTPGLTPQEAALLHINPPVMRPRIHDSVAAGCGLTGSLVGVPLDSATVFKLLESASNILGADESRHRALAWISTGESFASEGLNYAVEAMRNHGIATYAIDPVGTAHVIPGGDYQSPCGDGGGTPWQVVAENKHRSLTETARQSGGEAVIDDDDLAGGVRKIVTDFGSYYVLGFHPDDVTTPGDRPLVVRVTRPGAAVRARLTYSLADAAPEPADTAIATVASGLVPKGDLPLRLYAAALPNGANGGRVLVVMEVTPPNAPSDARADDPPDRLPYTVRAVDLSSGSVVQPLSNEASFVLAPGTTRHSFALRTGLALPPGHYQLRASAASARTGAAGSVFLSLDVPDFRRAPIAMSDVLVGDAREPTADTSNGPAVAILRSVPMAPTLTRAFSAGAPIHLYAEIAAKAPAAVAEATIALVGGDGTAVWQESRPLAGSGSPRVLDTTIAIPVVAAGDYALRVTVSAGAQTVHRDVAVTVK